MRILSVCVMSFGLVAASLGAGQSPGDVAALKQELDDLKKELGALRERVDKLQRLVADRPARSGQFVPTDIQVGGSPFRGNEAARITVVEFMDYECGFCARHFNQVYPRLMADFVEKGKIKYVVREFPLVTTHKAASKASEVALCAGDQGKYW